MDGITSTLTSGTQELTNFRLEQAREQQSAKLAGNTRSVESSNFDTKLEEQLRSQLTGFQPKDEVEENNSSLGKDDFLKILITQLQNQDPSKPMEDKEFISQMAQFTSLEQMTNMSKGFEKLSQASQRNFTLSLIGKQVDVLPKNSEPVTGVITEVTVGAESKVKINGIMYDSQDIIKVSTLEVQ